MYEDERLRPRRPGPSSSASSHSRRRHTQRWPTNESIVDEINQEKRLLVDVCKAIDDTKSSIIKVEHQIISADTGNDKKATKWKTRYLTQVRVNEQLEKDRNKLKACVENERAKIIDGWCHYPYLYELENEMSEAEWLRLIRQLEMVKANLMGELRNVQWRLDEESKAFHQLNDMCTVQRLEIEAARTNTAKFFNSPTPSISSPVPISLQGFGQVRLRSHERLLPPLSSSSSSTSSSITGSRRLPPINSRLDEDIKDEEK